MKQYQGKLFLTCLFLLGLLTIFPYGAHLDQKSEQDILYSNIKMYLHCLGGTESSLYSCLDTYGIIDIADSVEKDHGMAVYYPIFWILYINQASPFIGNAIWHIYIYLLTFCGVAAMYGLLRKMFNSFQVPALTTSLLFFTPRMFAESHYNNKDMVLLSLTICIFYFGRRLLEEPSWKFIIAFSLTGSLAANMKIIGLLIWGAVGLYITCAMFFMHQFNRKTLTKMLTCISLAVFIYMLLTPACWTGPGEFIRYLVESATNFRWNDYVLFSGNMYNKTITGMPHAYLPVMVLLTVPIGIIFLALIGFGNILFLLVRRHSPFWSTIGYACAIILTGLLPLFYAVLSGTPVYNGWRHFYFCYGSIIVMTAYGVSFLVNLAKKHTKKIMTELALWAYTLFLVTGILTNHPYEYAYYNVLAGNHIERVYELDYWNMSFKQAYEILLRDSADENITIGTISNPSRWGLEAQLYAIRGKCRMKISLCDNWQNAQYLIINPMYAYMYGLDDYDWVKQNYRLVDTISSYGNVICEIYQKQVHDQNWLSSRKLPTANQKLFQNKAVQRQI